MNKKVLVTGGAGYVGAHACKALSMTGLTPIVYDSLENGHRDFVRWGPFEHGNICDRSRLSEVFEKHSPCAVMHFAAFSNVGESVRNPGKYYENNVAGSSALLESMVEAGVKKIVFSSTCATYGIPDQLPITENTAQKPVNPYGRTKLMVENMLADFQAAHGLQWMALRYFNAAGADPNAEIGERHDPETHLIPLAIQATAPSAKPLLVFGNDYPTADGTCIRDYVHVCDLAQAHILALNALEENSPSQGINLGTGRGYSVLEVIDQIVRTTGEVVRHEYGPRREGDPPELVSNASNAFKILGWKPLYPDLATIIETAWSWHQKEG